ncbi:hypothetical protein ElyMa_001903200 [Elysia marginata]|uniref:Uncharacterized protein n=1 Tax=Elysia marginata TaxID=1093978 RepID=A0AAV4ESV3_9GAST|nr:hypothetical protein ElyMa_001903200 [Elysia marginata]
MYTITVQLPSNEGSRQTGQTGKRKATNSPSIILPRSEDRCQGKLHSEIEDKNINYSIRKDIMPNLPRKDQDMIFRLRTLPAKSTLHTNSEWKSVALSCANVAYHSKQYTTSCSKIKKSDNKTLISPLYRIDSRGSGADDIISLSLSPRAKHLPLTMSMKLQITCIQ